MEMNLDQFISKVKPHGMDNMAPPNNPVERHLWESKQLYSVFDCLHSDCSLLDYGCGGKATLQYTLFNHFTNAKYYGLDVIDFKLEDNRGFEILKTSNTYLEDIKELDNILPKVDCMVLGSVFTHLGPDEIIKVLDKTLPYYGKGFQLGFSAFLCDGTDIRLHQKSKHLPYDYYWVVVLTKKWIQEYCDLNGLEFIVQPFVHEIDHIIPLGLTHQNFITIKKNDRIK